MALQTRFPSVNPRLATYYAIFTSAVISLYFLLAITEQLGVSPAVIGSLAVLAPVVSACAIGLFSTNSETVDFYVSGRRVPPAYNGLAIASSSLGAAGLLGLTGTIFFLGYDALALGLGWAAGLLVMSVLFAPYLRKVGAYTLPSFFAERFNSSMARLICAVIIILPLTLLLIVELKIALFVSSIVFPLSREFLGFSLILLLCAALIGGGMRSLTWSQCALFIIVMIGILGPLLIISIQQTHLPLPQLTYGSLLDNIAEAERNMGVSPAQIGVLDQVIPGQQPTFTQKPFGQQFGLVGPLDFIFLSLCFMVGAATLPAPLARLSTTPTVFEARKSASWALAFVGLILISIPAYAVFTKINLFQTLSQFAIDQLPEWMIRFEELGIFTFANTDKTTIDMQNLGISRDGVFLLLPYAAQFPYILVVLTLCTVVLAAVAAACAQLMTLSNIISHDILGTFFIRRLSESGQVNLSRITIASLALVFGWMAIYSNMDSFKTLAFAMAITGSGIFAPLALSVWWRGCNKSGAILGMLAGAGSAIIVIWMANNGLPILGVDSYIAAVIGFPISLITTVAVSVTSSEPVMIANEIVDDIRVPGGEALYDRAQRTKNRRIQKKMALKQGG